VTLVYIYTLMSMIEFFNVYLRLSEQFDLSVLVCSRRMIRSMDRTSFVFLSSSRMTAMQIGGMTSMTKAVVGCRNIRSGR
jgi:hypothetical protein